MKWQKLTVLILPSNEEQDAFYSGTLDLLDYISPRFGADEVDIFVEDENYKELTLHSRELRLGTFLVGSIVLPLFLNVVSDYIYDSLKAKANDNVSMAVVVQKKDGSSISVKYVGEASQLDKAIDAIKDLAE